MILICDHRGNGLEKALRPLRGAGFDLEASECISQTRVRLREERFQLLILAPLVAGGTAEIEEFKRLLSESHLPAVLLVSDPTDPAAVLRTAAALNGHTWDVIRGDAPVEEFQMRAQRLVSSTAQQAELKDLRYRASHDDLTELLRPLYFQARLEEHFSATERHGLDLALLLIDLDRFGQINKVYDHTVGDRVISSVARVIRESLRTEDVAGRIGGDEFAILLPYTGPLEAAATVLRLCKTIHGLSGALAGIGVDYPIAGSIGFETTSSRDLPSVNVLRSHAESALREAKRAGGNRGVYYRSLGT